MVRMHFPRQYDEYGVSSPLPPPRRGGWGRGTCSAAWAFKDSKAVAYKSRLFKRNLSSGCFCNPHRTSQKTLMKSNVQQHVLRHCVVCYVTIDIYILFVLFVVANLIDLLYKKTVKIDGFPSQIEIADTSNECNVSNRIFIDFPCLTLTPTDEKLRHTLLTQLNSHLLLFEVGNRKVLTNWKLNI